MSELSYSAADIETALSVVSAAREIEWTWHLEDADRVCARLGWQLRATERYGLLAATGAAVNAPEARFTFFGGGIGIVTVNVTDMLDKDVSNRVTVVDNWFQSLTGPLTTELGVPEREKPAPLAAALWAPTPSMWVHLSALDRSVKLRIASPEYQEYQDAAEIAFGRSR
ncbi:DUF6301 family protein [Nocardia sp. NPDC004604]|uniref:DUF6301 family protein n=1 Tax=Nocardia sp. NPDC004604 TaxID=3157013 RepID=UPI0033BB3A65